MNNIIDQEFLSIVRCPLTHSRLALEGDVLVAEIGGLRYPCLLYTSRCV